VSVAFVAVLLFIVGGCGGGGGGNASLTPTQQSIADVSSPPVSLQMTSGGGGMTGRMQALPTLPSVQKLIASGQNATPDLIAKFATTPTIAQDDGLVACAYVLSQTKDLRAIQSLIDFLSNNLTGDVQWSLDATTRALKVLTDQTDIHDAPATYSPLEMLDTITRAQSWLTAHPNVAAQQLRTRQTRAKRTTSLEAGYVRIYLTHAAGDPFFWNNPQHNGASERVQFDLHIFRDPSVLSSSSLLQTIPLGGGTFLQNNPEGSEAQMGRLGICGGYALRELLRFGGSATPQGGWFLDPLAVYRQLTESGILVVQRDRTKAKTGDIVFWQNGANPATHAAIVQSAPPDTSSIIVRNKDEVSGVFTADIDASYYNNANSTPPKAFGTPVIYTYTGGEVPRMMVDTTMTQKTPVGGNLYLQNVAVVVK